MAWMMMLISVQPTLAFHFCGGALVSVGATASGCCCGLAAGDDPDVVQLPPLAGECLSVPAESCCADYVLTFTADDCTIPPCVVCGGENSCTALLLAAPLETALCSGYGHVRVQRLFPPPFSPPGGATLLAFICTFRL
jgi:hypothetical protein